VVSFSYSLSSSESCSCGSSGNFETQENPSINIDMDQQFANSIRDIAVALKAIADGRNSNFSYNSTRLDFHPFRGDSKNATEVLAFITKMENCFCIKNWNTVDDTHFIDRVNYFVKQDYMKLTVLASINLKKLSKDRFV
jgi:hypothetical protein